VLASGPRTVASGLLSAKFSILPETSSYGTDYNSANEEMQKGRHVDIF